MLSFLRLFGIDHTLALNEQGVHLDLLGFYKLDDQGANIRNYYYVPHRLLAQSAQIRGVYSAH
jgi:hypothetical protein